jgi:hypothetical protein
MMLSLDVLGCESRPSLCGCGCHSCGSHCIDVVLFFVCSDNQFCQVCDDERLAQEVGKALSQAAIFSGLKGKDEVSGRGLRLGSDSVIPGRNWRSKQPPWGCRNSDFLKSVFWLCVRPYLASGEIETVALGRVQQF